MSSKIKVGFTSLRSRSSRVPSPVRTKAVATPALAPLAEQTCWQSVAPELEPGSGTVGAKLSLEHTAPTPVGMHVTCESELIAVEGRKLTFTVTMRDEKGPVGQGVHERVIINDARFLAKAEAKRG